MKPIVTLKIGALDAPVSAYEVVTDLNDTGRGFITAKIADDATGAIVRLDLGYNNTAYRWFTGYVERDQPSDNGFRRLFVREMTGVFEKRWPLSLQHPTLRQVTQALSTASGIEFILPAADYTDTPIPHFVHSGTGWQLLNTLGRAFGIDDYIWQQLPDGSVWLGRWQDSRFAGLPVDIPTEYASSTGAGNSVTLPLIPSVRPGAMVNGQRITRVAIKDGDMTLTWTPLNANGQPKVKPAFQRQLEQLNPEIAAGLHLPKFARVENYTEPTELGDIADPFRPKYAVGVQLLDENGQDSKGTPSYPAVQLPVTMGGDESGFMQYPPPGTLVELAFQDGRQDKPFIRQVFPSNASLPAIKPGEQLQQQRAGVFQRVTAPGDWHRETDQAIREVSASRTVEADKETRKVIDREITVQADDSKTVLGTSRTTAGAVTHIARGDYTVGTSANLKTAARAADEKIAQGKTVDIGGALTERIAGVRQSISAALQLQAATTSIGDGVTNILTLLTETLDLVDTLAQRTAEHTHSNTGTPTNAAEIGQASATATALKGKYSPLIG
ncbi:Uncharacterised protein [Serratia quinivorans]|uniref:hypothetical protein n=1 Tax=Serratia quinivorans TaxID=137545 RepID=UPI00217C657B|nr:hypothetical protein [Serratia quinivorans]CAI2063103.1 Uncharacterised protein [Serratia quinivorans]